QRTPAHGAALSADARDAELARKLDTGGGVLVLLLAIGRVGIDVVAVAGQRTDDEASLRNLVLNAGDGGVVQAGGVEAKLHAGEAFALDERQVRIGVLAENTEFGFPVWVPPLGLSQRCGRGQGGKCSASGEGHQMTILRSGARCKMRYRRNRPNPIRSRPPTKSTIEPGSGVPKAAPVTCCVPETAVMNRWTP